jgi:hypothetical protein
MGGGGHTSYAADTCDLVGDGDLYGIGVRISYYLFFGATLVAILRRSVSKTNRTHIGALGRCAEAVNILTFAILFILVKNTLNGSFATLEWFLTCPTIFVAFFSLFFALPWGTNTGRLLCYAFTLSLLTLCQPWLYWRRIYQGRKSECVVRYWFFGVRDFYGETWTMFFKVMSILACVLGGVLLLFVAFCVLFRHGWERVRLLPTVVTAEDLGRDISYGSKNRKRSWMRLRLCGLVFLLFVGVFTMAMTEKTISANRIDLASTPLDSTSQLIPFITGLLSFLTTLYSCLPFRKIHDKVCDFDQRLIDRCLGRREKQLPLSNNSSSTAFYQPPHMYQTPYMQYDTSGEL